MSIPAPLPENEAERLAALHRCHILDTLPEEDYDDLVFLAAQICGAPVALISLADAERQWFKAHFGLEGIKETPRSDAFCAHALLKPDELMLVPDAAEDPRFADGPLIQGPLGVRFYAGAPIVVTPPDDQTASFALGTVCVVDQKPRQLTDEQERALRALSRQVGHLLDLRLRRLLHEQEHQRLLESQARVEALAEDLGRSNAALEQFAAVASHDLKEPLRKIQTFGAMLEKRSLPVLDATAQGYLSRMKSAASRAQTLVEGILTLSKASSGAGPQYVALDLNDVVAEVLGDLEARIEETQAKINVKSLPSLTADSTGIRQVLQNLIGNALKFHRPDHSPCICICGGEDKSRGTVWFTVQDDGIGFDQEQAEKIFVPFERLEGRAAYEGNGVGLSICQRVVESHGGIIRAESQPGEGSSFTVTLPLSAKQTGRR